MSGWERRRLVEVLRPDRKTVVAILGTGGFAIELESLLSDSGISVAGFVGPQLARHLPRDWLGDDDVIGSLSTDIAWLVAVGDPGLRRKLSIDLLSAGLRLETFIHSSAHVSKDSEVGEGCVIYPNSTIHAGVRIKDGVLINSNATIGHETTIGEYSNLGPGVAVGGWCQIGEGVNIGIGASLRDQIKVLSNCVVGAGATVISDIQIQGTYVGVPAKRMEN